MGYFNKCVLNCDHFITRWRMKILSNSTTQIQKTNRNKICFAFVSVCFVKPKRKKFGLFRCFKHISKQPKQTDLFRNKPKQTETTLNFWKNFQIYSLLNCLGGSSVCFGSIETHYRSETTETKCFETNRKNQKKRKNRKKFRKN